MKKMTSILVLSLLTHASFASASNDVDISQLSISCVVAQEYLGSGETQKRTVSFAYEAYASSVNEISRLIDVSAIQYAPNGNDKIKLNNQKLLIKADFRNTAIPADENGMPLIQLTIFKDSKKVFSTYAASHKDLNIKYENNGFTVQIKKCEYENTN